MADVDEEIKALQKEREAGITAAADGEGDTGGDGVGDADAQNEADRVALTGAGAYDKDIYGGGGDKFAGFTRTVVEEEPEDDDEVVHHRGGASHPASRPSINAPRSVLEGGEELAGADEGDPFNSRREMGGSGMVNTVIADRETAYQAQHRNQMISPMRGGDAFAGQTPQRSFKDIMAEQALAKEKDQILRKAAKQAEEAKRVATASSSSVTANYGPGAGAAAAKAAAAATSMAAADTPRVGGGAGSVRKKRRWDDGGVTPGGGAMGDGDETPAAGNSGKAVSDWDADVATPVRRGGFGGGETPGRTPGGRGGGETPGRSRWDQTPSRDAQATPVSRRSSRWDQSGGATPVAGMTPGGGVTPGGIGGDTPKLGSKWDDETPRAGGFGVAETPSGRKKSRWDQTPQAGVTPGQTPGGAGGAMMTPGATPQAAWTPGQTPSGMMTPSPSLAQAGLGGAGEPMTPELAQQMRWERELDDRNRPLTDEDLDAMFPPAGYRILDAPVGYAPIRTPSRRLLATPTPMPSTPGFKMMQTPAREEYGVPATPSESSLPFIKPEDYQYFGKLMDEVEDEELNPEEAKERKILRMLLKIKNGTPPQRKTALRQITDKAREFGAGPLFNQILPLLMSPTLEDQERHLLVKVIDRILYKLDDLVRPYVHKILVVIEPLLIDEDYYARVEGREIISNLAKAAGLATMIATMRPDIDNLDEYVRNTTARAFAVVASALGIPALLPFLKAVCQSRKSWQARHTGIKIVMQIAILMGCAVLPHLRQMVEIVEHGLVDEQQKVRTITALALSSLAEAAHPYGIESFDRVLRPLWKGIRTHRGKGLAAFLKAIGFIIPLMDATYANYYTREVMVILIREFQSPDEEMKKIVLKVVKQCVGTDGVDAAYVKEEILPEYFRAFWVRRMALDRRNHKQVVETTVEIANKVGVSEVLSRIVEGLKDDNEPYRRMVMETIEQVIQNLGAADIDTRLEEQLIDGILFAFQEQTESDTFTMLNGFGTVVNALGLRAKAYLPQISGTVKWRLNNKSAKVRMQASDLIARIAVVMKTCGEEVLMSHLGVVLYEYLGEEYPEVLGSILGALKAIVNVIGMSKMKPPISELLPRLTPILKNRHEKVQENCIDLVGRIADRGPEHVSAREWMRICFELLEMLKAHKKAIRRAAVNTFGYIAKAIGPQDVLHTLLNNLKVQERQNRVCTTVAIAIVAETCAPFTVVPALMNEFRVPELNVQNGVLKALSFMFEYIGEMAKDYIYAVTPLLEDALMDRDLVHRQTACTTVKHLSLGVAMLGCEDALVHLLNFVWPNIFETSPHVINAVFEAIEGMSVALGVTRVLQYVLQGLFHPARRVREVYWKLYNSLYMLGADALTPAYPRLTDDGRNAYRRTHLELFV